MSRDLERITTLTEALVTGFDERIEYRLSIKTHTAPCLAESTRLRRCACPTTTEMRVKTVRQRALIAQLEDAIAQLQSADSDGRAATVVDPPLPGNFAALDLIDEIRRYLASAVRRARLICGYDVPAGTIRGFVCGHCGGGLRVEDGRAVCTGTADTSPCGTAYAWQDIAALIGGAE
ncbi:hypothetical protein [Actinacidiphila acididurans]|uniref:Uncharacterized protein n=1 Tax=Actinacidiphila acididurans TaxID=2784346 RepID=A0ABS2TRE6_9ACTN|nr:hypothetical protein [Actinacidiphila acididurans]MBM9504533.1 hypothetical protein [Actinacidiphila acididurans]